MNKYDKKILEMVPTGGTIHELTRRPIRSLTFHLFDTLMDSILYTIDGLKSTGAYYLVMDEAKSKAELIHFTRDLHVSKTDVTTAVKQSENKNFFKYDGHKYKLFRKVK